jgi:hypothetical protein
MVKDTIEMQQNLSTMSYPNTLDTDFCMCNHIHYNQPDTMLQQTSTAYSTSEFNQVEINNIAIRNGKRNWTSEPDTFDGEPKNYNRFLTAEEDNLSSNQAKVLFTLSYMKMGSAELQAENYVQKAIESKDWGGWPKFLTQLDTTFINRNAKQKAHEQMDLLHQWNSSAIKYFFQFESLALTGNVDLEKDVHVICMVEKGLQRNIVEWMYQGSKFQLHTRCFLDILMCLVRICEVVEVLWKCYLRTKKDKYSQKGMLKSFEVV